MFVESTIISRLQNFKLKDYTYRRGIGTYNPFLWWLPFNKKLALFLSPFSYYSEKQDEIRENGDEMGRKTVYQTVYNRLRYQILSGEAPIGTPLPSERRLAEEWGVSRNTVVRAYEDLESEGLIWSKMGSGRFVQPLPPLSHAPWLEVKDQLQPYPSYMADLLSAFGQDSAINFSLGHGGKQMLAMSGFPEYVRKAADNFASYHFLPISGHTELREWAVDWMGFDQVASVEDVLMTSGSQEALQLITAVLANPGDTIAVEMPTYFGALQLFQSLGMRIIPIPMDRQGMVVDVLEGVLNRYQPKFLYTVPTFHNPTGTTLSLDRRKKLLQLSERLGFPIVEDDAYRHLHFGEPAPPALKSLDQTGQVIYVNTFSKMLFPGLRLGWIAARPSLLQRIARYKELTITNNSLGQHALLSFLKSGAMEPHLKKSREVYQRQAVLMESFLQRMKPSGLSYDQAGGGFYYWISLPENLDVRELLLESMKEGVLFATGDMFLARETQQPYIRLSFSFETEERIREGMEKLETAFSRLRRRDQD
ncbi:PLP-dependent aminotransferase family protein [Ammoniphilus sp. YIM 78166]|uniref:MocR-like pyridoxine biosynthesis transcription factor PdxR n=1 Tax=Ammoniphilus sp. YIM 78166 TaxID=1644106 RepID=UPI001F102C9D|nr:PLP-dependent aminotransferase family protein [Ammoniphilus sp. YIM 78166]